MSRKVLIVWNEARNEGVVFVDSPIGREDARQCATRRFASVSSSLGEAFAECYDEDNLHLEEVELS